MNIRPVGAELLHADRQTDMMDVIVAFAILQTHLKIEPVLIKQKLLYFQSVFFYFHFC
jgi:hypothetical protein